MKYLSCAKWPENTLGCNDVMVTTDRHDSKEAAESVCQMLEREGYGGNGKIFPVRTWVESTNDCVFDGNGVCGASVCYSSEKCNSRDAAGNPAYD